ncbi:MAG: SGNH/GDSL hydrolase family protein [Terracidiphilus sp.]
MKQSISSRPESAKETKLPRRDWILLPVLSLLTICVIAGSTELIARRMLTESRPFIAACIQPGDLKSGLRAVPNAVCWDKKYESEWVEYRFNSCGHRAGMECGPKTPGIYRIVMIGSSFPMGHLMQREKTFAALLPVDIFRRTGRKIELYNQGMVGENPYVAALRMNETLALQPDMILWTINPIDIEREITYTEPLNPLANSSSLRANTWFRIKNDLDSKSLSDAVPDLWKRVLRHVQDTRSATLIQGALYKSRSQFLKSSLAGDDSEFMRVPADAQYQPHLQNFDRDLAAVALQAKNAHIPLVVTLLPIRAQAALISMGEWPAGIDPYMLDNDMRAIVTRHGGIYVDVLPDYRSIPDPEQGFLPIDGHPNANGHATISRILSAELTSGVIPALTAAARPETAMERGR